MKEFIEKLIGRLEEYEYSHLIEHDSEECLHCQENDDDGCGFRNCFVCVWDKAKEIVNQLAEEYNNDFCEWEYDDFEDGWQTSCGTTFSLCDSDKEITHYCPCCGKKIKVVE